MGDITSFLREIKQRPEIRGQYFDPSFLKNVVLVLENRGYAEAKLYVWDSHLKGGLERQASAVLSVISQMEDVEVFKNNRAIGGRIIKNLGRMPSK